MKKFLIAILLTAANVFPQTLVYQNSFGNFTYAVAFDIDLNLNFFVVDKDSSVIIKLDTLGNIQNSIGGYGWEESTFDDPVDIFTNTLSVYVADRNNNRIQRFDKDLNFLSQYIGTSETAAGIEFAYPTCITISAIGDLFILDSDNSRILKFSLDGQFISVLGGNDAGNFSVTNPKYLATDNSGNLYVIDEDEIKIFDQYGNGLLHFEPVLHANKISITDKKLFLNNNYEIAIYDLHENKLLLHENNFNKLPKDEFITDVKSANGYLFILTQKKIYKYKFPHK